MVSLREDNELTHKDFIKLRQLIRNHVQAQIQNSWKGGMHPEDYEEIDAFTKYNRNKLNAHIRYMESKV